MSSSFIAPTIAIVGILALHIFYEKRHMRAIDDLSEKRLAERKGRIRAEQRLRELLRNRSSLESADVQEGMKETPSQIPKVDEAIRQDVTEIKNDTSGNKKSSSTYNMNLKCIGTVVSPFTKRMGTPRQGALVPHGRGFIDLSCKVAPMETLQGIEVYSHAWIIFQFHANTDFQGSGKTKVRPPRANGEKIGQMATRSPHRPNAIGLSLVKIDDIDYKQKRLYISGLDLVNGTPVYDIKPVVPWDIPGYFDRIPLAVPDWVREDDTVTCVSLSNEAEVMLENSVLEGKLEPLYTRDNDGLVSAKEAIKEVLAQDPRARKKRGTIDLRDESCYKIVFCSIQIEFRATSDDSIQVLRIVDFNMTDAEFVDGIPLYTG